MVMTARPVAEQGEAHEAAMETESLAVALEREHQDIDAGIAAFTAGAAGTGGGREPLTRAIHALRRHIYLEEEILFPLLREAEPNLMAPIFVMLREHAQMWRTLGALERELGTGTGDVHQTCRQLSVALLHHNLKEEKVLYPRADQALTEPAAAKLREFLRSGEMPAGWACIRARR
jgi:regulator of cell morphogenesis and NO signaling